jgi:hypothetical protein
MADEKVYTWKITGRDLPPLHIPATSFDAALAQARKLDRNYCTGQIVEG